MPNTPITKYRPSFTEAQMDTIMTLCNRVLSDIKQGETQKPFNLECLTIIGILTPLKAKILANVRTPDYIATPRETLAERLGFETEIPIDTSISKEAYWEQCYNKYINTPDSCNLQDIKAAKEHMYINNLMTPEQEAQFELDSI